MSEHGHPEVHVVPADVATIGVTGSVAAGPSLRDEIVDELRERIISGELRPGERLRERALSEEFGVSRVPVREAILVLEQQRLLRTEPRVGATVTDLTGRDVAELFDVRLALEPLTAALAARSHTEQDIAQLESDHARAVEASRDRDARAGSLANADFHLSLLRAAHSELLWQAAGPLHPQIQRLFRQTITEHEQALCADHGQILAAVLAGDEELAAFWARRHVEQTRERSIAAFG